MRSIQLDSIRETAKKRFGRNTKLNYLSSKTMEELTGCKAFRQDKIIPVELFVLFPMPGADIIWVNQEVVSKKAEKLHRRYYYDDPKCHIYRDTLYCVCLQVN